MRNLVLPTVLSLFLAACPSSGGGGGVSSTVESITGTAEEVSREGEYLLEGLIMSPVVDPLLFHPLCHPASIVLEIEDQSNVSEDHYVCSLTQDRNSFLDGIKYSFGQTFSELVVPLGEVRDGPVRVNYFVGY